MATKPAKAVTPATMASMVSMLKYVTGQRAGTNAAVDPAAGGAHSTNGMQRRAQLSRAHICTTKFLKYHRYCMLMLTISRVRETDTLFLKNNQKRVL